LTTGEKRKKKLEGVSEEEEPEYICNVQPGLTNASLGGGGGSKRRAVTLPRILTSKGNSAGVESFLPAQWNLLGTLYSQKKKKVKERREQVSNSFSQKLTNERRREHFPFWTGGCEL